MITKEEILKTLAKDKPELQKRFKVHKIALFGSYSRGDQQADSDVDILITLDPERSLLDLIALKQEMEDLLGCKVDVVTEASVSPYIRPQVLRDAVAL